MKRAEFLERQHGPHVEDSNTHGPHQKIIRSLRRAIEALAPYTTHRTECTARDKGQPCNCGLAERLAVAQRLCMPSTFNQRMRGLGPPTLVPGGGKHVPLHAIADLPPSLPPTPKRLPTPAAAPRAEQTADERLLDSIRRAAAVKPERDYYPKRAAPRSGKRSTVDFGSL